MKLKDFKEQYKISDDKWNRLIKLNPELLSCIKYKRIGNSNYLWICQLKLLMNILQKNDYEFKTKFINIDELSKVIGLNRTTLSIYLNRPELNQFKINGKYVDELILPTLYNFLSIKLKRDKLYYALNALDNLIKEKSTTNVVL